MLQTEHLKRYRDIVRLLMKFGGSDLLRSARLPEGLKLEEQPVSAADARELTRELEAMGPTFVKLGQLLSTRADLLSPPYLDALSRLQDNVAPFPFEDVERIVAEDLKADVFQIYATFSVTPLAAASLGQVHRATLPDGMPVAVKVQRPDIRHEVAKDLEVLEQLVHLLQKHSHLGQYYDFVAMFEDFRRSVIMELDYTHEARNLTRIARQLRGFRDIVVPAPVDTLTTERVLTMELIDGEKISDAAPVRGGARLADEMFHAYLHQILINGTFHADPHPGNVFITTDGRLALIDFGQISRLSPRMQETLFRFVLATADARSDDAATLMIEVGGATDSFDEEGLRRAMAHLVGEQRGATVEESSMGESILQMCRTASAHGVRVAPEVGMIGKTLMDLDEVTRLLDRHFNPRESVRRHAIEILMKKFERKLSPGMAASMVVEIIEMARRLPHRFDKILDTLANDRIRISLDAVEELQVMTGLRKIANRVTLGLILAALIVAAALMMRVPTDFYLFGYPGLPMAFFLMAALGGIYLVITILRHD